MNFWATIGYFYAYYLLLFGALIFIGLVVPIPHMYVSLVIFALGGAMIVQASRSYAVVRKRVASPWRAWLVAFADGLTLSRQKE